MTHRILLLLAVVLALTALGVSAIVQMNAAAESERLTQELARLRLSITLLSQQAAGLAAATADKSTAESVTALQERIATLEEQVKALPAQSASFQPGGASASTDNADRVIDPSWPTEDCIPTGTRFMAVAGDNYPICKTPAVVRVSAVTGDAVVVEGAGTIVETGFGTLAGTTCTLMVFAADIEGFAEMRVTCQ